MSKKPESTNLSSEKKKKERKGNFKFYIPAIATVVVLAAGGIIIGVNASDFKKTETQTVYKETTVSKGNITAGVTESGSTALGTENFNYDIGTVSSVSTGSFSASSSSSSSGLGSTGSNTTGKTSGSSSTGSTTASSSSGNSGSSSGNSFSATTELEVEEIYVAESTSVTEGAALLKVTTASYQKVLDSLTDAVSTAELSLKEAQIERTLNKVDSENTYSSNKSKKTIAQETYNNTVAKLQNAVDKAKQALDEATAEIAENQEIINTYTAYSEEELEALAEAAGVTTTITSDTSSSSSSGKSSVSNGSSSSTGNSVSVNSVSVNTSSAEYKAYKEAVSSTQKVEEAKEKLEELQSSYTNLELNYQESLVSQKEGLLSAKEKLDEDLVTASNADDLYEISINGIDDDVESAEETLENAKKVLAAFQAFVVDGVIYSDFEGMVTEVDCQVGGTISNGSTLFVYANPDEVTLTVSVDQEDIASVALDDEVNIEFTAYSGISYKGIVTAISTSTSSEKSSTVSYSVTVTVSGDVSSLYSGMTADVTFVTKEMKDVLYVSNKAIKTEGTKSYVTVKDNSGSYIKQQVTTGFSNGNEVEIQSGLEEGDTVYIESQVNAQ